MAHLFKNRRNAGELLGVRLASCEYRDVVVLGLPRGGVPVAYEVAAALDAPLDVVVVRKLRVPDCPDLAMGAIASGGIRVLVSEVVDSLPISRSVLESVTAAERAELERHERDYHGTRPFPPVAGSTVVLVDDGVATGASMIAAARAVRVLKPASIVAAAAVMSEHARRTILEIVDAVECVVVPAQLFGVGSWYDDFTPTTDAEVRALLNAAASRFEMHLRHS